VSLLISTAGLSTSNSFVSVERANQILAQRLYTTKWDAVTEAPNADGYLTNATASIGASTVAIDTGTGTFLSGTKFKFAGHATIYTATSTLSAPGTLSFSPALTSALSNNEAIERQTANDKEKSLIWATTLFESMIEWDGWKNTATQRLRVPRSGLVDADGDSYASDTIPEILEIATAEFGLVLLERNKFKLPSILGQGVSQVTLGPLSATVDSAEQEDVIPQNILALLDPIGKIKSSAQVGGTKILPLYRA